jgi:hypothetical protein
MKKLFLRFSSLFIFILNFHYSLSIWYCNFKQKNNQFNNKFNIKTFKLIFVCLMKNKTTKHHVIHFNIHLWKSFKMKHMIIRLLTSSLVISFSTHSSESVSFSVIFDLESSHKIKVNHFLIYDLKLPILTDFIYKILIVNYA